MKKLFIFLAFSLVVSTYSQDISNPKPIVNIADSAGNFVNPIPPNGTNLLLGCGINSFEVKASWTQNVGSPDEYRVEQIDYNPKSYLPTAGSTVITPAMLGVPGAIIADSTTPDDQWGPVQQLASNGSTLEFCYFGEPRNEFIVSSNAIVSFDTTSYSLGNYSDWNLNNMGRIQPNANCGDNKDAILQIHDTYPTHSSALFDSYAYWAISGTTIGERFFSLGIHHMPMYGCGNSVGYATHQMIFYETTNIIEFHIQDKPLCMTWPPATGGVQAFGLQNKTQTVGQAVPGLDNESAPIQILDLTDGFYDGNFDAAYPVISPKSYRFIPDGNLGVDPVFAWYLDWTGDPATSTFVSNDPILTVLQADVPATNLTYTAVVTYVEYCSGNTFHSAQNVTFELENPLQMFIKENNSADDTIEFIDQEEINLCEGETYDLEAIILDDVAPTYSSIEWVMESFGNAPVVVSTATTYTIPAALAPNNYIFTCTITDGTCVFSDTVAVDIFDQTTTMNYPAPKQFCRSDVDADATPVAASVHPTAPAGTTDQAVLEEYYYTVNNNGVWLNPLTDTTRSLDGILDLSASLDNATNVFADGSANFEITYHAHCPNNTVTDTILIKNAPDVIRPIFKDLTATPPITDNNAVANLITQCGNAALSATFDITAIENAIANNLSGLDFVWVSNTGGVILPNPMPANYNTTTIDVTVTVTDPADVAACAVVIPMKLDVVPPVTIAQPIDGANSIHLKVCESTDSNGNYLGTATFNGQDIEDYILDGQDPNDGYEVVYYDDQTPPNEINFTFDTNGEFESGNQTIIAEVKKGNCVSVQKTYDLEVINRLEFTSPADGTATLPAALLELCETDTVNHTAGFDTTNWNAIILSNNTVPDATNHLIYAIEYLYTDSLGALITTNTMPNPFVSETRNTVNTVITVRLSNQTYLSSGTQCFDEFEIELQVRNKPVGTPAALKSCSTQDTSVSNVNLDLETDYVTLTNNTYEWYADLNANITGQTNTDATTPATSNTITESLYNTTEVNQVVTYHITPISENTAATGDPSNACAGNAFVITVTIYPEPVVENYDPALGIKTCSGEVVHVLEDASQNPIPLNLDEIVTLNNNTYSWYAEDNANVTGETTTTTTGNIINDVLINTNTTDIEETVIYHITPTSEDTSAAGGHTACAGKEIIIEVKIGFAPDISNQTAFTCSENTNTIVTFDDYTTLTGNTYTWYPNTPNPNVIGVSTATLATPETTATIDDDLTLVAGITTPQTVVYNVIPTSGCEGNPFTVTVTVNPLPKELTSLPAAIEECSIQQTETIFNVNINLDDYVTLTNNTYEWYVTYPSSTTLTGIITNTDATNFSILNTIEDRITNTSTSNQTVTYHIIPTSENTSAAGDPSNACQSAEITIDVIINPEPIRENYDDAVKIGVCSGEVVHEFNNGSGAPIPLRLDDYTSLSNDAAHPNTYTWYADSNADVSGISTATQAAPETTNTITDVLTNNQAAGMDSIVTYHITPTSDNGCKGVEYILEIIVSSKPVGTDTTVDICSGEQVSMLVNNIKVDLDLDSFTTFVDNGDGLNHNTYKWKAQSDNPNIDGETLTEVVTNDIDTIITDVLINNTSSIESVIYEVTPSSAGSCDGDMFTITVNVGFAPVITDQNEVACNDISLDVNLNNYTNLIGNTYKWQAVNNDNVTGETTVVMNSANINDVIINTTGEVQIVQYNVLPFSAGKCEGNLFSVFVSVNPRPDFELQPQYFICPEITTLDIGETTNPDNYNYKWYMANNVSSVIGYDKLLTVTISDLAISDGTYILEVEDPATGCTYSQFTTVSVAEQMAVAQIHVSDFNRPENSIIIEMVGGSGVFEYTLHYTDFAGVQQSITQNSPIFENLVAGTYQIEVVDSTSCSITVISQDIYVLDYPPFFTPNGDTVHDTWQIKGANLIPDSKIYVFDRYGKVLAQLDPNDYLGWDGTYNGVQVPASDYWFTAQYLDPNTGNQKSVKGHFSIVRK